VPCSSVALQCRSYELADAVFDEYGSPATQMKWHTGWAQAAPLDAIRTLVEFDRAIGSVRVRMQPLGVVGIITPWNADAGFIITE
jgi:aldehyde dehydrogenase (NAD+)